MDHYTSADLAKHHLCQTIERVIARRQLTQHEAAVYARTSRAVISRIANKHVNQLTFNQLFNCLNRLAFRYEMLISI